MCRYLMAASSSVLSSNLELDKEAFLQAVGSATSEDFIEHIYLDIDIMPSYISSLANTDIGTIE